MEKKSNVDNWNARWTLVVITTAVCCGLLFLVDMVANGFGGSAGEWIKTIARMLAGAFIYRAFDRSGLLNFGKKSEDSWTQEA